MEAHTWEVIVGLATALQGLTAGIIRYLLREIDKRDAIIAKSNEAVAQTNKANAEMAALVPTLMHEVMEWRQQRTTS